MKEIEISQSKETDIEDFKAMVEGLVASGAITREQGEYGCGLDEVKDQFRPIAEAELDKQGK